MFRKLNTQSFITGSITLKVLPPVHPYSLLICLPSSFLHQLPSILGIPKKFWFQISGLHPPVMFSLFVHNPCFRSSSTFLLLLLVLPLSPLPIVVSNSIRSSSAFNIIRALSSPPLSPYHRSIITTLKEIVIEPGSAWQRELTAVVCKCKLLSEDMNRDFIGLERWELAEAIVKSRGRSEIMSSISEAAVSIFCIIRKLTNIYFLYS